MNSIAVSLHINNFFWYPTFRLHYSWIRCISMLPYHTWRNNEMGMTNSGWYLSLGVAWATLGYLSERKGSFGSSYANNHLCAWCLDNLILFEMLVIWSCQLNIFLSLNGSLFSFFPTLLFSLPGCFRMQTWMI